MASITMATAAAPGFSPLLGSALDHLFGWRSEFVFVAVFALCTAVAYATFVGETKDGAAGSLQSAQDCRLLSRPASGCAVRRACQNRRPVDGRSVRRFLERAARAARRLRFSADHARSAVCRRCFPGVWRRHAGAETIGAVRLSSCDIGGPGIDGGRRRRAACRRCCWRRTRCRRFSLRRRSSCSGWASRARCRVRRRYRHSATRPALQRPCSASRKWRGPHAARRWLRSSSSDPAIGLGTVLALTSLLALILHRRQRRTGMIAPSEIMRATSCDRTTRRRTASWHGGAMLRSRHSDPFGRSARNSTCSAAKERGIIGNLPARSPVDRKSSEAGAVRSNWARAAGGPARVAKRRSRAGDPPAPRTDRQFSGDRAFGSPGFGLQPSGLQDGSKPMHDAFDGPVHPHGALPDQLDDRLRIRARICVV